MKSPWFECEVFIKQTENTKFFIPAIFVEKSWPFALFLTCCFHNTTRRGKRVWVFSLKFTSCRQVIQLETTECIKYVENQHPANKLMVLVKFVSSAWNIRQTHGANNEWSDPWICDASWGTWSARFSRNSIRKATHW